MHPEESVIPEKSETSAPKPQERKIRIYATTRRSLMTVAAACFGAAAAGIGYDAADEIRSPLASETTDISFTKYTQDLKKIAALQTELQNTTDDEDAGSRLDEMKKRFTTKTILDKTLSERALGRLAVQFNDMSLEDGIRFRSYNFSPATIARRDECLRTTAAKGDDYATAQAVESCMIERLQNNPSPTPVVVTLSGALTGGGIYGAFGWARRRKNPSAP